jgi:uncharacterized protein (DUF927 family)
VLSIDVRHRRVHFLNTDIIDCSSRRTPRRQITIGVFVMSTKSKSTPTIKFQKDGIYIDDGKKDPARVADSILVTAFATSDPGTAKEQAFTAIKFMNRHGRWRSVIVPSSLLTSQRTEFITLLSRQGYVWPRNQRMHRQIISALSVVKPTKHFQVTAVPGWHGKFIVMPDKSYGPKGPDRDRLKINYNPTVNLGDFRCLSTMTKWKRHIAKNCIHSSRARLALAAVFAAPTLRMLNLDTFGFNFSGQTSGGKTLLLRWGLSVPGLNSSKGPATWDGSPAAFEQRALGHRDSVVPLDDLSHLQGDPNQVAKIITFRLAGNKPRAKAGQYVAANNLVDIDWRDIALSTSEDPLWQSVNVNGQAGIRGEQVRMIDVPACVSDRNDIFDGPHADKRVGKTLEERVRFVEKQERLTLKYQGKPYRAYLKQLAMDKSALVTLNKYMAEFREAAPLPIQVRWLARIRRNFEATYAGAALAIDYGVLPWGKKPTLAAIVGCMNDAMAQLTTRFGAGTGASAPTIKPDTTLLAEFKKLIDKSTFIRIDRQRRKKKSFAARLQTADGVVRTTKSGKIERLLLSKTLEAWFPLAATRKQLVAGLRSRRIFGKGRRPDTSTRQVFIAELGGKVACYALSLKRLGSRLAGSEPHA